MNRFPGPSVLAGGCAALLVLVLLLPACSDDPILGPSDGAPREGGSYSSLNRLAPPAGTVDTSASPPGVVAQRMLPSHNPERF
jgi:hypothetical protein